MAKVDESPLARVGGRSDHIVRLYWTTGRNERTDGWKEGIVGNDVTFVGRRKGIAVFWTKNESMAVHHHNEDDDASQQEADDADYDQMVVANHRPSVRLKLVFRWFSIVVVGVGIFYIWKLNRTIPNTAAWLTCQRNGEGKDLALWANLFQHDHSIKVYN